LCILTPCALCYALVHVIYSVVSVQKHETPIV